MTIGQIAKEAGVNVQTVRYYERRGLVIPEGRRASGYREYGHESVKRILFVRHAQEIGFSLREIDDLLTLRVDLSTSCADVKRRAQAKMDDLEQRMSKLETMHKALHKLIAECDGIGPLAACPIIQALDETSDLLSST